MAIRPVTSRRAQGWRIAEGWRVGAGPMDRCRLGIWYGLSGQSSPQMLVVTDIRPGGRRSSGGCREEPETRAKNGISFLTNAGYGEDDW